MKTNKEKFYKAAQHAINRPTNWQRHQWARAGYPGRRPPDADKVLPFVQLARGSR